MKPLLLGCSLMLPTICFGQDISDIQKAGDLGNLLASEEYCGLSYDQSAISAWIDTNTDPADMGFANMLATMTAGAAYGFDSQTTSQKTAHCHSVERSARHLGFVK